MGIAKHLKIERLQRLQDRLKTRPSPPLYRVQIWDFSKTHHALVDRIVEVKRSGVLGGDIRFGDHGELRVDIQPHLVGGANGRKK